MPEINEFLKELNISIQSIEENIQTISITFDGTSNHVNKLIELDLEKYFSYYHKSLIIAIKSLNDQELAENILEYPYTEKLDINKYNTKDSKIRFKIIIDKKILNNSLQIDLQHFHVTTHFNIDNFEKKITSLSLNYKEMENLFFDEKKKNLIIFLEETTLFFENEWVIFLDKNSINEIKLTEYAIDNRNVINIQRKNSSWLENKTQYLIPNYFYFENIEKIPLSLKTKIYNLLLHLSLLFICNSYEIENETKKFIFYGDKRSVVFVFEEDPIDIEKVTELYELYVWAYSKGNNTDKLSILRNTIVHYYPNHIQNPKIKDLLEKTYEIRKSVSTNFDIYLNENIEKYFKQKNIINESVTDYTKRVSDQIENLMDYINKMLTTGLTFVAVGFVGYVLKVDDFKNLLGYILFIYLFYLIVSLILSLHYSEKKVEIIEDEYNEKINLFLEMFGEDVPKSDTKEKYNKMFKNYYSKIKFLTLFLIIIFIGLILYLSLSKHIDEFLTILNM